MTQRYQKNKPKNYKKDEHHQLMHQLKSISLKTIIGGMTIVGPRDLAQTALGFAKIVKMVDSRGQRHFQETPQQILRDLLIGQHSQQQQIIF